MEETLKITLVTGAFGMVSANGGPWVRSIRHYDEGMAAIEEVRRTGDRGVSLDDLHRPEQPDVPPQP